MASEDKDAKDQEEQQPEIKLRGEDDYYARAVTIQGVEFRIRELTEEEHTAYLTAAVHLRELSGVEGLDLSAMTPDRIMELVLELGIKVTPEKAMETRRASWGMIDGAVVAGVVGWELAGHECSEENIKRLPNHIKRKLSAEILRETQLTTEEDTFLPLSPRP